VAVFSCIGVGREPYSDPPTGGERRFDNPPSRRRKTGGLYTKLLCSEVIFLPPLECDRVLPVAFRKRTFQVQTCLMHENSRPAERGRVLPNKYILYTFIYLLYN